MNDDLIFKYKKIEVPKLIFEWGNILNTSSLTEMVLNNSAPFADQLCIHDLIINSNVKLLIQSILDAFSGSALRKIVRIEKSMLDEKLSLEEFTKYNDINYCLKLDNVSNLENIKSLCEELNNIKNYMKSLSLKLASFVLEVNKRNIDESVDMAVEIIKTTEIPVVLEPAVSVFEEKADALTWYELDLLYRKISKAESDLNNIYAILIGAGNLPTRLLTEHPCNAYVCSGSKCHSEKKDLPRRLVVAENGNIFPESLNVNSKYIIGNLNNTTLQNIFQNYSQSEPHLLFKNLTKYIFLKYIQTCPYRVVPWESLFSYLSQKNIVKGENKWIN